MSDDLDPVEMAKPRVEMEFPFSIAQARNQAKVVFDRRNELAESVQSLISRFNTETETRIALIPMIMQTYNRNGKYDLRAIHVLGKVLIRLTEILREFQEMDAQSTFINFVMEKPEFVALMFGDLEKAVNHFVAEVESSDQQKPSADDDVFNDN